MNIINLTSKKITEVNTQQVYAPSEKPVRLDMSFRQISTINNVPVFTKEKPLVKNLPPQQEGTFYIVCGVMLNPIKGLGRNDCIAPGEPVRNKKGVMVGCNGFVK